MTTTITSRSFGVKGFVGSTVPTLADVMLAIERVPGRAPQERSDLLSAVRKVAEVLGLPPADVPALPGFLRQRLAKVAPAAHGLGKRRWANVRSLLRQGLKIAGVHVLPNRYLAPYSPSWKALDGRIGNRSIRLGLARLMHFASAQDLEPESIDDEFMAAYRRALHEESLLKEPHKTWRNAIGFWNRAVEEISGWPQRRLAVPVRPGRYWLPWTDLPGSLREEVEEWLRRLAGETFLEDLDFKPFRPATIRHRRSQIRELVSAQVAQGRDVHSIRTLADLIEPETVKTAMRFFHARSGGRCTGRMLNYGHLMVSIAKYWVRAPQTQVDALRAIARQCDPGTTGMTLKNRDMLRRVSTPEAKLRLVELPYRLIHGLEAGRSLTAREAHRVELALLLQLLLRAPMRLANLVSLQLGRHIMTLGGPRRQVVITIPREEVKNDFELSYPLAEATRDLLQLYIDKARPRIATAPTPFLFPGRTGAKAGDTVRRQIASITERELGVRLTPHQFRHLAGKFMLDARPGCHELVRALLGHKTIETTLRFYAGMEQDSAVQHYDEVMAALTVKTSG
jgi:integrase